MNLSIITIFFIITLIIYDYFKWLILNDHAKDAKYGKILKKIFTPESNEEILRITSSRDAVIGNYFVWEGPLHLYADMLLEKNRIPRILTIRIVLGYLMQTLTRQLQTNKYIRTEDPYYLEVLMKKIEEAKHNLVSEGFSLVSEIQSFSPFENILYSNDVEITYFERTESWDYQGLISNTLNSMVFLEDPKNESYFMHLKSDSGYLSRNLYLLAGVGFGLWNQNIIEYRDSDKKGITEEEKDNLLSLKKNNFSIMLPYEAITKIVVAKHQSGETPNAALAEYYPDETSKVVRIFCEGSIQLEIRLYKEITDGTRFNNSYQVAALVDSILIGCMISNNPLSITDESEIAMEWQALGSWKESHHPVFYKPDRPVS